MPPSLDGRRSLLSARVAISPKLVLPNLVAKTPESAIKQLAALLVSEGYVDASYTDAVLTREQAYPTGIEFPACGVALPHGEPDAVHKAAIAFGRCSTPVRFHRMDDFEQEVGVQLVVLLAVTNPEEHLEVLGKLIKAFSDEGQSNTLLSLKDATAISEFFCDIVQEGE